MNDDLEDMELCLCRCTIGRDMKDTIEYQRNVINRQTSQLDNASQMYRTSLDVKDKYIDSLNEALLSNKLVFSCSITF